jgi:translation initiation factor IF-1
MRLRVHTGDEVELSPVTDATTLNKGDIVLVRVSGRVYLHLIRPIQDGRFQIGNNRGGINGWVGRNRIYGRVEEIR